MKKYVKITSLTVIILLMLQIIFPVITNIEFDTSYAATTYTDGYLKYTYNGTNTLTITGSGTGSGTVTSSWKTNSVLNASKGNITKVVFNTKNITAIGANAFSDCNALTTITYTAHAITSIGNNAFSNCTSLTTVTIPNTVTTIGSSAFSGCTKLATLTIGEGVTSIASNAFYNAPLTTKITYNAINCTTYNNAFKDKQTKEVAIGAKVTQIPNYFISGNRAIETVTIPATCISIGDYAFKGCSALKTIKWGGTEATRKCETIGRYAFSECTALTEFSLPKCVNKILDHAFYNCSSLESLKNIYSKCDVQVAGNVRRSNNCELYGDYAFYGTKITEVIGIEKHAVVGTNAFPSNATIERLNFDLENYMGCNQGNFSYTYTRKIYIESSNDKINFKYWVHGCGGHYSVGRLKVRVLDSNGTEIDSMEKKTSGTIDWTYYEVPKSLTPGYYTVIFTLGGIYEDENPREPHGGSYGARVSFVENYDITYNGNGNTGGSTSSQTKAEGESLSIKSNGFIKRGYTFQN